MRRSGLALAALATLGLMSVAEADPLPTYIGTCTETEIEAIGTRLGTPDSGSVVSFVNGGVQISYDPVPGIINSRVGDRVHVCLVFIPQDCPPGDDRGKIYRTTNLRTGDNWELPDSQHSCGGA